ncbi:hypothetical protein PENANT_c022G03683 [Penicillium antarcticum]|uniref:Major facilitator superfamily (MFS) profile domain-containing protein n=1 Tax=Penicillium antarcticum TaxID=416450 RepID=A0A1V6PZM2_9EURO|nr:hypothetical protein PENANT_c022G03683 [Penicillium antarcticum]
MTLNVAEHVSFERARENLDMKNPSSGSPVHLEHVVSIFPDHQAPDDTIWENNSLQNPRNWSSSKKNAQILMVAFHSMMGTFMAAGIIPAYDTFAEDYNITVPDASYLTSFQILLLGLSPLIWNPITAIYGRYPVTLFSVFGSMICNIGGARCTSYGAQMATRVITAFLISPPIGNGSGVITELCEPEHRGKKLGWWTLMTTIGTPAGPFFMGFVIKNIGVQWIFWIFAIINLCQFLFYLAFGDETIYNPENERQTTGVWGKMIPRKISSHSLKLQDIIAPFSLAQYPRILIAACAHAITFCYANIALVVEMPIAFGEKFHFDAQQIGLQFIAIVIGCVLGEQVSGPMCDWFLGRVQHATTWNVTPCVGAAIASFGNQMQTTILTTFAVESKKERASQVGVFVNICRQIYGFLGPFYFPDMFTTLGLGGASGVMVAVIAGCALFPIMAVQFVASRSDKH